MLGSKIAKRKILDELASYPDPMSQEDYERISQRLKEEMSKSHAVRINIGKIQSTMNQLLSEVEKNVIEAGLEDVLNDIKIQASIIAVGSVIAHEGEHSTVMTGEQGDPRGESSAEATERNFIEQMLQKPEFEYVKPFLRHDKQSVSNDERNQIIEKIRMQIQGSQPTEDSWYRVDG